MVNLYLAYTAPINPPGATPALTTAQCWTGLQRKVRNAPEFVGAIATCTVLNEDDDGVVTRQVTFKANPNKVVEEVCRPYEPMKVDFHQTDGSVISNIISDGPSGEATDLHMTYAFQWLHPDVEAGSAEEKELMRGHKATAKMAVDKSIEAIRRLVNEGKI
ncbi:hypothetical protein MBLNU459_g6080t1 [Dothideomycetes sp. NU459]